MTTREEASIAQLERLKRERQRLLLETPGVTGVGMGQYRGRNVINVYLRRRSSQIEKKIREMLAHVPLHFKLGG